MEAQADRIGNRIKLFLSLYWASIIVVILPLICLPIFLTDNTPEKKCLYVVVVVAIFWVTEALPLPITSMIPIFAFPLLGIMETNVTCMQYFKETVVMFVGGLILAIAIEHSNLHKRVALKFILLVGFSHKKLHFSLMTITMFISMWIVNTAAAAMMCPIILAVLGELESQNLYKLNRDEGPDIAEDLPYPTKPTIAYFLGAAYASSLGGVGTIIGTGTNLTVRGIYEGKFKNSEGIDFTRWMFYNIPVMLLNTALTWLFLQWLYMGLWRPNSEEAKNLTIGKEGENIARTVIEGRYRELGRMNSHEISVSVLFISAIMLFFTRSPGVFMGWADIFNYNEGDKKFKIGDATAAVFIVILFFVLPATWSCLQFFKRGDTLPITKSPPVLSWNVINTRMPWGLIFLLGGGFALAEGGQRSGMSKMIGNSLKVLESLPMLGILFVVLLATEILTEFAANVAIANIILPVLAEMSLALKIHPLYFMLPAGIVCSMAFHLPVGTPPNAVVAGYANIRTKDMALAGVGPTLITLFTYWATFPTWGMVIYPEMASFPDWAVNDTDTT